MRGFSKLDNPTHEGKTNTWLTPLEIVNALGKFDLDPCGVEGHLTADRLIVLPECGLAANWEGRVWLNPPYGKEIGKWLNKLESHGNGIAIVFSRTDTKWFQDLKPTAMFFMKGRIAFLKEDKTKDSNAGHGSVLLIFGENNIEFVKNSGLKGILISPSTTN